MSEKRFVVLELTEPETTMLLRILVFGSAYRTDISKGISSQRTGINKRTFLRTVRKVVYALRTSWPDANGGK